MKSNCIRILAVSSLIAIIGVCAPVQSAVKKPLPKVKTGKVSTQPVSKMAKNTQKPQVNKAKAKPAATKSLPRLLDLGSSTCIPCKMMVPVLDKLTKEYKGKLKVEFIDVGINEAAARKYKINTIPTQIFFNAKGKEVSRHIGFFPKDDILKVFKDNGIKLK